MSASSLVPGSFVVTPYYTARVQSHQLPAPLPENNYTQYDLFCLRTQLIPYTSKLATRVIFRLRADTTTDPDVLLRDYLCLQLLDRKDVPIILDEKEVKSLQDRVDTITKSSRRRVLMWLIPSVDMSESWFKREYARLSLPIQYSPSLDQGYWLIDLSMHPDYEDVYSNMSITLTTDLERRWKEKW